MLQVILKNRLFVVFVNMICLFIFLHYEITCCETAALVVAVGMYLYSLKMLNCIK